MNNNLNFKYIIIGNSGSGKTSFINYYHTNNKSNKIKSTLGVEFSTKKINLNNKDIHLQLWDTAGQEKYLSITQTYYRGAVGVILLFDLTDFNSFNNIKNWYNRAFEICSNKSVYMIIGNKNDWITKKIIKDKDIKELIKTLNKDKIYFESNAINGENIENSIWTLSQKIYNKYENNEIPKELIFKTERKLEQKYKDLNNENDKLCYNC